MYIYSVGRFFVFWHPHIRLASISCVAVAGVCLCAHHSCSQMIARPPPAAPLAPPKTALCLFSIEANHFRTDKPICLLRGAVAQSTRVEAAFARSQLAWPGMVCHLFLHPIRVTSRKPSLVWIHLMYRSSRAFPQSLLPRSFFETHFLGVFRN